MLKRRCNQAVWLCFQLPWRQPVFWALALIIGRFRQFHASDVKVLDLSKMLTPCIGIPLTILRVRFKHSPADGSIDPSTAREMRVMTYVTLQRNARALVKSQHVEYLVIERGVQLRSPLRLNMPVQYRQPPT